MIKINMQEVGKRIKELRTELKMSQTELANKVGVATNTICQYESGLSKASIDVIVNLAVELDTSTDYLLGLCD